MPTIANVVAFLEDLAPPRLAAEWDNTGLLLGDPSRAAARIMTCLTVTPESAKEAVEERADLVVAHHPMLFKPVKRVTTATVEGRMLLELLGARTALYSPHTSFDNCASGINALLAERLRLRQVRPLAAAGSGKQFKLVVFTPEGDLARVSQAMFEAGAGVIGQYRECSYRLLGTGTFLGTAASNPTVGERGKREEVSEWRLEVVCPAANLEAILAAMRQAHSYEEPAYDLYPLHEAKAAQVGEGRVGELPVPTALEDLGRTVRELLSTGPVQIVGAMRREVRKVAIACGAGGSFISQAAKANADVLLTGEARFHDCLAAEQCGLALVLPGHYASERLGAEHLATQLQAAFADARVWPSRRESDPIRWVT